MPELPEVETMRRGVAEVAGRRIRKVVSGPCTLKPILLSPRLSALCRRLADQRIESVDRVGKRLVLRLQNTERLVLEPRMSGLILLADPPDREHLRLVFELSGRPKRRLLFWSQRGLGTVQLLDQAEFEHRLGDPPIGPDALAISVEELARRLGRSRRAIKVALLDQRAVAGIGNIYASEILHVAGVPPSVACETLRAAHWRRIHAALRQVLLEAIEYEGSTLGDGTYRNAKNRSGRYQNHHRVYARAGNLCRSCGDSLIERIVQGQRSTFFCPNCQNTARNGGSG